MKNMKMKLTLPNLLLGLLALGLGATTAPASLLDTNFNVGAGCNGIVETVLEQPDGKILICGNFTEYNGYNNGYIVRLNSDGSVDSNFVSSVSYEVRTMALQTNGQIVIGGFFTSVAGQSRNLIARLNADGSLDTTFNPGTGAVGTLGTGIQGDSDPFVFATAIQPDGKILITGNFTNYNGVNLNGVCRLNSDGSLDTNFDVGGGYNTETWGRSVRVETNGQIMLTGWFSSYHNQNVSRMALVNPDGSLDTSFAPNFGQLSAVYDSLQLPDGNYLVVGDTESNVFTAKVAELLPDGSYDSDFYGSDNDKTESVKLQSDGKILIGGYFGLVDGQPVASIARLNADGTLDTTFGADVDNFVWDIAVQSDGKILIGGGFQTIDNVSRNGIARLLPSTNYVATGGGGGSGGGGGIDVNTNGITISTNGMGKLTFSSGAKPLAPGKTYTVTAKPAPGYIFAGWSGSVTSSAAQLRFTPTTNFVLAADFIANPYPTNAGTYYGLFYSGPTNSSAGWLTFTVGSAGGYSAHLVTEGTTHNWSGKLTPDLTASNTISVRGEPVTITLGLAGDNSLTGFVTGAHFSSSLTAYRPAGATNLSGYYTVLLPGATNGAPAGDGYLSLDVNKKGTVSIAGVLADGTAVSGNSVVSSLDSVPFYAGYGGSNSAAYGWLTLDTTNADPVAGTIYWNKDVPGGTNFSTAITAVGGPYTPPKVGTPVVSWTNAVFTASGAGLASAISNTFTLRGSAGFVFATPNTNHFAVTFNTTRGVFSGSLKDPATGGTVALRGAILQGGKSGAGFFLSRGITGLITITNGTSVSP